MRVPLSASRRVECLEDVKASPECDPAVAYPGWYVHRWHFLPEGYMSRRGVVAYERAFAPLYNVGLEGRVIRAVLGELRREPPASVLDIGCGPAHLLRELRPAFPEADITGVDLSPFHLEVARDRLAGDESVTLVHADSAALPLETATFEAAVAIHVVGHQPEEVAIATLNEAARVLEPGGRLLLVEHRWHPRRAVPGLQIESRRSLLGGLQVLLTYRRG